MIMPRLNSLYWRIFAVFWLTLFLVLVGVLAVQHNDPRHLHKLSMHSSVDFKHRAAHISKRINAMSGIFEKKLIKIQEQRIKKERVKFFFTNLQGEIYQKPYSMGRAWKNFITLADNPEIPMQRLYGQWMLTGPFLIIDNENQALMFVSQRWREARPFYVQLLDSPFELLLVTMAVSTPLLLWLAWAVTRPARRLQMAAERVADGRFETDPALEKGPNEFRLAGASFNQMVTGLNQMIRGQQRLLSDISHELRSPLTRLRMANALAIRKQGESSELIRIDTEAERMEKMIADLLSLSRSQLNSHREREIYTLEDLWEILLEDAEFEATQLGKCFRVHKMPSVKIEGNGSLLCSALENVVRNATKYANPAIAVSLIKKENNLIVEVNDDGEGIPVSMLKDIFRPFYRVSTARERETGSTGLGLAITDSAMRQHNGYVEASLNEMGGLKVCLIFGLSKENTV